VLRIKAANIGEPVREIEIIPRREMPAPPDPQREPTREPTKEPAREPVRRRRREKTPA